MSRQAQPFDERYLPEPNTGCWLWLGGCFEDGYGQIKQDGKTCRAHRVSYERSRGPIPDGLCVCHTCDTPSCVNPDHLFLGTNADNLADRDAKGRTARGDRNGSRTRPERRPRGDGHFARAHPERLARGERSASRLYPGIRSGERNGRAKLSAEQVVEIRNASGTHTELARQFHMGRSAIARIRRGQAWAHINNSAAA